ncbi:MAG: DegQ family serine endoprotease [Planctomycetota bacterium]
MQVRNLRQKTSSSRYPVISTLFLLLFFVVPPSAFAQDPGSVATLKQMGKAFASIAEKTSPAVVGVKAEKTVTRDYSMPQDSPFGDDFFYFFRQPSPRQNQPERRYKEPQIAQGSGFIISAEGYILTNNHVVDGAEKVTVELADNRELSAKIIGTDPESDVAVLKIDAGKQPYLELANSDTLEVGEWVLAIGNPLGLSHTVTAGIVSATGRSSLGLATLENFIQTDAAINFGNSGGPLINLDGKVVGMNTAIVGSMGNIGIGFAIPINMAKHVYDQLIEGGTVEHGFLGVMPETLTSDKAPFFGLEEGAKGVLVTEVTEDSPAAQGGMKHNDVIVELNGDSVESADVFRNRIAMLKPGSSVKLIVWRDGKRKPLTVELGKRPSAAELSGNLQPETVDELGFSVQNLTEEVAARYGYEGQSGVIVDEVQPGSEAARNGIVPGALIKEVNLQEVKNTRDFNDAIKNAKKKGRVLLLVRRGRYQYSVILKLTEQK